MIAGKPVAPLLTCALGSVGGAAFALVGMPLPWMLGSMVATALAAVRGIGAPIPISWRNAGLVVLGVAVGSAYGPESFGNAAEWVASLGSIALYSIVVGALCTAYFYRVAKFDVASSFFSGMPGGMNEMVIVGQQFGANARRVALSHAVRVIVVVTSIALGFRLLDGYIRPIASAGSPLDLTELGLLALAAALSVVIARLLRLPAPFFLGPLLGSLAVHALDFSHVAPPSALLFLGQVVVGASLGGRFNGTTRRELTGTVCHAGVASLLQMLVTLAGAVLLGGLLELDAKMIFLAFAPAGIAEMTLIALALGYDPAFVAVHQLARLLLVFVLAPAFFRIVSRRERIRGTPE